MKFIVNFEKFVLGGTFEAISGIHIYWNTTRFESSLKILILFSLFREDIIAYLSKKKTFDNIGQKHIIHFMVCLLFRLSLLLRNRRKVYDILLNQLLTAIS